MINSISLPNDRLFGTYENNTSNASKLTIALTNPPLNGCILYIDHITEFNTRVKNYATQEFIVSDKTATSIDIQSTDPNFVFDKHTFFPDPIITNNTPKPVRLSIQLFKKDCRVFVPMVITYKDI